MADTPVTLTHELGRNTGVNGMAADGTGFGFGGSWIWIILLFLLFGRNGFGGNADTNTVVGLTNEMLLNNLQNSLNSGFNQVNQNLCNGFSGVQSSLCNLRADMLVGFGEATHQRDMNTCAIKSAIHADGEATRALINANTMQELRERLATAEAALNNSQQTATIVNSLRPYPTPAYFAPNPAVSFADAHGGYGYKHYV